MTPGTRRIFLIRHGQVDMDWQGRIYGALDVPLSELGKAEARGVAELLELEPIGCVVSSGLARTEYGAACLRASRRLSRVDDRELRELERGAWVGLDPAAVERAAPGSWDSWFRAPGSTRPPGGESLQDLLARTWPRIKHWGERDGPSPVAIVTHGWVIRVLLCHVLGIPLDLATHLDVRTGDVHLLEWTGPEDQDIQLGGFALDRIPMPSQLSE